MQGHEVVIVIAIGGGARQQQHVRQGGELGQHRGHPLCGRATVDRLAAVEQRTAHLFLLVAQDDARTAAPGGQRGGQATGAGADDEHVAVMVHVVVDVRIALDRATTQACGLADVLLVLRPRRGRRHEGLVVEARRHELTTQGAQQTHHVAVYVGPAIGALGDQAVVQRLLRGAHVGHLARFGGTQLHDGVGLIGSSGHHTTRTGVLEAAIDDVHTIGEQGRGERVAGKALEADAIEVETQRARAVDAAAGAETIALAHFAAPLSEAEPLRDSAVTTGC